MQFNLLNLRTLSITIVINLALISCATQNNSLNDLKNINVEKFMSRQDLPTLYCTSGAIYGRTYNLQQTFNPNKKSFCFGKNPIGVVLNDIESINIDRPIDFKFAEFIAKKKIDGN